VHGVEIAPEKMPCGNSKPTRPEPIHLLDGVLGRDWEASGRSHGRAARMAASWRDRCSAACITSTTARHRRGRTRNPSVAAGAVRPRKDGPRNHALRGLSTDSARARSSAGWSFREGQVCPRGDSPNTDAHRRILTDSPRSGSAAGWSLLGGTPFAEAPRICTVRGQNCSCQPSSRVNR